MKVRYEEMTPKELTQAVKNMPVFIVPAGLLEWHGDHLPLGQDALKAHGISIRVAEKLGGGIVLPPNYYGRPGFSTYIGTLTYSEALIRLLFWEIFEQLIKIGARVILVITGHYGSCQVKCLKGIAEDFNRCHPKIRVIAQPEYEGVRVNSEVPADHAGKWETSMFWQMYPNLIKIESFKPGKIKIHTYPDPPQNFYHEKSIWEWKEDLREIASQELGEKALDIITNHLVSIIQNTLSQIDS